MKKIQTDAIRQGTRRVTRASQKEPWQMTRKEFMQHHYTGSIRSDAYRNYGTREGLSWVKPETYPQVVERKNFGGVPVEIRRDNHKIRYVSHDENEEIKRGPDGLALYLTDDEAKAKGYALEDGGYAAFVDGQAVGFASNEWGAAGVWVVEDMQRKGLGTHLLRLLMKEHPGIKRIGQMTSAGWNMTEAYHRSLVQDAINEGKPIPHEVEHEFQNPKPRQE
jgi:GNAT superfamily N-acetyltransferase